ncbi:MAG: hypothetical protein KDD37_01415 [Bdellovibrionales bacterium]|nr:hypothetical protein [Bdellovibrionales bacterium]
MFRLALISVMVVVSGCSTYRIAEYQADKSVKMDEHTFSIKYYQDKEVPFNFDALMQDMRTEGYADTVKKHEENVSSNIKWTTPIIVLSLISAAFGPFYPLIGILPLQVVAYNNRKYEQEHIVPAIQEHNKQFAEQSAASKND